MDSNWIQLQSQYEENKAGEIIYEINSMYILSKIYES